ncbi:MAG: radical SAM protein [Acidimicrobiia bacterium]|nr:radical SAM protein [Acidimicrobiia bacterium]
MTVVNISTTPATATVSRSVMVAITNHGICVPVIEDFTALSASFSDPLSGETIPLDQSRLQFLLAARRRPDMPLDEVAAEVAATHDGEAAGEVRRSLDELVADLGARSLLGGVFPVEDPGEGSAVDQAAGDGVGDDKSGDDKSGDDKSGDDKMSAMERMVVPAPVVFRVSVGGFERLAHDGTVVDTFGSRDLGVLNALRQPRTRPEALMAQRRQLGDAAMTVAEFDELVVRARRAGLLEEVEGDVESYQSRSTRIMRREFTSNAARVRIMAEEAAEEDRREVERHSRTGIRRINVVPVANVGGVAPLALGMVFAYAKQWEGGQLEDSFHFRPEWLVQRERLEELATSAPSVFLFSNYLWSHALNLEMSALVKAANPNCVTIHGGPDTPKYPEDVDAYFRLHQHVDVTVRGEGEATLSEALAALEPVVGDRPCDLTVLADVAGLSFRHGDEVIRTEDRDRIADLDTIPSPYLSGLFDLFAREPGSTAIIETNRGCPYGCTFCDWGSSTLSRIRKFSLERVFEELEWVSAANFDRIFMADANFGIFERDVDIARKVGELRQRNGSPRHFITNYAKNTVKHLKPIVASMVEAGVLTEGLLSLQSMDDDTLGIIRRSNIKLERYEELAREFRRVRLPLYVDLMLGLPGSTTRSFRNDLQECINREVTVKVFPTELLVNSPMNAPDYRRDHRIETSVPVVSATATSEGGARPLVVSSSSFTRADYDTMMKLRRIFLLCENYGVLRQVARHVRKESGTREADFYDGLRRVITDQADLWPDIAAGLRVAPVLMVAPGSWRPFIDEVGRYVVEQLGLADDSALRTVLDVQHALLPSRDRRFPDVLDLSHDYAAWHAAMLTAKDEHPPDEWTDHVPHLREFGPATFEVTDPHQLCTLATGFRIESDSYGQWEFGSPIARPSPRTHLAEA